MTAVAPTLIQQPAPQSAVNVKLFGAAGNGRDVIGLAIAMGTALLSAPSPGFAASDVGKLVMVDGAGAAGGTLSTTIQSVAAGVATLAATAATTVGAARGVFGTDDSSAIAKALLATSLAVSPSRAIFFPKGIYCTSQTTHITTIGAALLGVGEGSGNTAGPVDAPVSEIRYFGAAEAVFFDGGASGVGASLVGGGASEFSIAGSSLATNLLRIRNLSHGFFSRVRFKDCAGAAIKSEFAISNVFVQPRCTSNEDTFFSGARPLYGADLGARGVGEGTTSTLFLVPIFEGLQNGIRDGQYNNSNVFIAGTSEGMTGYGLICHGVANSVYQGMDLEANGGGGVGGDILVDGGSFGLSFLGMQAESSATAEGGIHFKNAGGGPSNCVVTGGEYFNVTIDAGCAGIEVDTTNIFGTYTDNGSATVGTAGFGQPTKVSTFGLLAPGGATVTLGTLTDTLHVTGDTRSDGVARFVGVGVPAVPTQPLQVVDQIGSPATQKQLAFGIDTTQGFALVGVGYVQYVVQGVGFQPLMLNTSGGGLGFDKAKFSAVVQGSMTISFGTVVSLTGTNSGPQTVMGVQVGDRLLVASTTFPGFADFQLTAIVSAANTVIVSVFNQSGAPQVWPANLVFRVDAWRGDAASWP